MKYQKSKDVFYRSHGENSLVVKTGNKKVYMFDGNICEVLNFFNNEKSCEELLEYISQKYAVDNNISLQVLENLVNDLVKKGILVEENILSEKKNDLEMSYKYNCLPENQLFSAQFELTFRCNERCRHCYCVQGKENELTTEELKKVLDDLYDMGVFEVTFTGGDLFVRKDAFEILDYAYSKNFLITVFTNGIALTDSDIIHLKSLHIKSIHFSIYSSNAEKHDAFTRVNGSFEKTISVIKKCVLLDIPVNIKTCILNYNQDEIEDILELAKNLGTTIQLSLAVSAKNDGDKSPTSFRLENEDKYVEIMRKVNKHLIIHCSNDFNMKRNDDYQMCGAGKTSLNINPYGDVYPCNSLLLKCGNVKEQSIKDIWNNSAVLKEIRKYTMKMVKGCENCEYIKYCGFCPGSAMAETEDPLCKYDEACIITNAKRKLNENKEDT